MSTSTTALGVLPLLQHFGSKTAPAHWDSVYRRCLTAIATPFRSKSLCSLVIWAAGDVTARAGHFPNLAVIRWSWTLYAVPQMRATIPSGNSIEGATACKLGPHLQLRSSQHGNSWLIYCLARMTESSPLRSSTASFACLGSVETFLAEIFQQIVI